MSKQLVTRWNLVKALFVLFFFLSLVVVRSPACLLTVCFKRTTQRLSPGVRFEALETEWYWKLAKQQLSFTLHLLMHLVHFFCKVLATLGRKFPNETCHISRRFETTAAFHSNKSPFAPKIVSPLQQKSRQNRPGKRASTFLLLLGDKAISTEGESTTDDNFDELVLPLSELSVVTLLNFCRNFRLVR